MKTIRYAALVATAGLVLAGCGDDSTSGAGESPTAPVPGSPTPTGSPTPPTSRTPATDALPLTVTRNGGVVGFSDRVVVGPDGMASMSRRGNGPTRCRLDRGLLNNLTQAVDAIDWSTVGENRPTVRHPDDLIVVVAAQGGLTRLEDPRVKPLVTPVGQLLSETSAPLQSRKLCKPA